MRRRGCTITTLLLMFALAISVGLMLAEVAIRLEGG